MHRVPPPAVRCRRRAAGQLARLRDRAPRHGVVARLRAGVRTSSHQRGRRASVKRVDDEPRDEREAARVAVGHERTELVADDGRRQLVEPRSKIAGARCRRRRWRSSRARMLDGVALAACRAGCACASSSGSSAFACSDKRVGLDAARSRRASASVAPAQQVRDALRAIRLGPLEAEQIRVVRRRRPMIGGDDEVRRADRTGAAARRRGPSPVHSASPVHPSAGRDPSPLARTGIRPGA